MPYNYQLSEEAESDVYDSFLWYEKQKEGLGEEFLEALDAAGKAITINPTTYRIRFKNKVRAFVVDRFPYLILYIVNGNDIDVISVFNTNQHPRRWKERLK
ncbi:ParE toxin of type II toxin-antitoxin system, parDE [Aquiflexum balticum DSM 16537]|uniref:ParE toxin of type II toxin-antitoxin system, parDE n=1 Tax=Aquiflexum balticum DSM 16537 TaxID=758820 RepID=A0A1W2HBT7_9BACT|nr:type II toxin-antitoxin system RelE/ParE family toxin [Aquiflexum balticum]SMD46198.1 ParE toxin of type II toxin-antitoxin system, parDE [Aquiflexum balticum DSM 16537]